jgi:hypothetical protein
MDQMFSLYMVAGSLNLHQQVREDHLLCELPIDEPDEYNISTVNSGENNNQVRQYY